MKAQLVLLATIVAMPMAHAADVEAGKARVATVCAACHGANGVSVAASFPNLAGQKLAYLTAQLQAFKAGERKNDFMNAMAGQLSDADIDNVAAFLSSLPGAASSETKSALLPSVAKSRVTIPADYKTTFTRYLTMDFPDSKQVRYSYANPAAIKAARAGGPLPDGSMILVEVYNAKLDEQQIPVKGSDGFFAPGEIAAYVGMQKETGWGAEIPDMLRNDNWNYAPFTVGKIPRDGFNQAVCFACHKPKAGDDYLFSMKELREVALRQ